MSRPDKPLPPPGTARPKSAAAFAQARQLIPGGVDSPVRAFAAVGGTPVFMARGQGCRLTDLDGRHYTDWCASWGAMILGHAHRSVSRAASRRLGRGSSFGAPTPEETRLAGLIRDAMPSMERLRFVSSGTEAVMSALRLARGYTGRDLVLKFDGCYHGHADHLLVAAGSGLTTLGTSSSAGVPGPVAALTLSLPYNDCAAVDRAFASHRGQIAAVIVEPVAANMGLVTAAPGFLEHLRRRCTQEGSLLVFDEVITGFRTGPGGVQGQTGIQPDLSTLGKIIGGGFPAAAYGGRQEIMALLAPDGPVYQAGTLSGNPVAMAAGIATLETLRRQPPWDRLAEYGATLARLSAPALAGSGCSLVTHQGLFTLYCRPTPPANLAQALESDTRRYGRIFHRLLDQGHYTACAQYETNFVGVPHRERHIRSLARALAGAVAGTGPAAPGSALPHKNSPETTP